MASSKAAGEEKPEAYLHFTRPALSRPGPALSPGYVEDFSDPRTPLGAFFNILLPLSLFVPWILAQHTHHPFAANHFTFRTNRLDG